MSKQDAFSLVVMREISPCCLVSKCSFVFIRVFCLFSCVWEELLLVCCVSFNKKIAELKVQETFQWISRKLLGCLTTNLLTALYFMLLIFLLYFNIKQFLSSLSGADHCYLVEFTWCPRLVCSCSQSWVLVCFQGLLVISSLGSARLLVDMDLVSAFASETTKGKLRS